MSLFRYNGSKVWTMKFTVHGQFVRKSTGTRNKTLAEQIERDAHRSMERGAAGIPEPQRIPLFNDAADEWLEFVEGSIEPSTLAIHKSSLRHLRPVFGTRLLSSLLREEVKAYQRQRLKDKVERRPLDTVKPKTVNLEVETLRAILIHFGQWERIKRDVKMLKPREDDEVGRELSPEEQSALEEACQMSRSRLLPQMVALALETGARDKTIKQLRWKWVNFEEHCLRWGKDKTPAGSGRVVPLNSRAFEMLKFWAELFPNRKPDHFVFPAETYGGRKPQTDPASPVGSVKTAWNTARLNAAWILAGRPASREGIKPLACRFHDLRHTAVSRMLKSNGGNIQPVGRIVGWSASTMVAMSKRYAHYQVDDLRATMEGASSRNTAQNTALPTPQSATTGNTHSLHNNGITQ